MGYCYNAACASLGRGAPAGMTEGREYAMGRHSGKELPRNQLEDIIVSKQSRPKTNKEQVSDPAATRLDPDYFTEFL